MDLLTEYSVTQEEEAHESLHIIEDILTSNEDIHLVFSHMRDKVWLTNKRIIAMDVQGLTGKKKSFRSFPYSKISSFSIETAGTFDGDSDFKIWLSGVGLFEIKFRKKLNIKKVAKFLSEKMLA
ncbi:MAG: PH domain-containing protein [Bacteroidales bacterium]